MITLARLTVSTVALRTALEQTNSPLVMIIADNRLMVTSLRGIGISCDCPVIAHVGLNQSRIGLALTVLRPEALIRSLITDQETCEVIVNIYTNDYAAHNYASRYAGKDVFFLNIALDGSYCYAPITPSFNLFPGVAKWFRQESS